MKFKGSRDTSSSNSEHAFVFSPAEDKVRASREIFEDKFNALVRTLSQYSLTAEEIETKLPALYRQIQEAITAMDSAWFNEDLEGFLKAIKTIEGLYFKALHEIPEW